MATKTNAMRIIDKAGISYKEAFYEVDSEENIGLHAAHATGLQETQVFKTLVARGTKTGIHVFCIPVCCELDLKKAAKAAGDKSITLLPVKELLSVTGYVRGGCSPVGMKKKYPVYLDISCLQFSEIAISAGERGHQLTIPTQALIALISAGIAELVI